jgi:malonyl-CoA/methylmalonyl-CoA synthetase
VNLSLIQRAAGYGDRTAVVAAEGCLTYRELLRASQRVASTLLKDAADLREARVAYLAPPGLHYVAAQWGIWRAAGVAVPLAVSHPPPELDYIIADSQATIVLAHPELAERVRPIVAARGLRYLSTEEALAAPTGALPEVEPERRAMIFYTSGTTARPKGAVHTHGNIEAQVRSLVTAWEWTSDDRILGVLPLHHIHGVINVLTCALWAGATCELLPRFDPDDVWNRIAAGGLTLFMAVPTIYGRLIAAWEQAPPTRRAAMSESAHALRLMVSGSAALPVSVLEKWKAISGHVLLERYGMTEIGMALSNPLHGERVPGTVGTPLPAVEVRLADDDGVAEIEVRGPGVFLEYWGRPDATREAFRDGWFRTGDVAVVENGRYRILGRKSVDIIKTGGYKVSALEIEEVLRTHPDVRECAVVGVADEEWGECVCAAVEPRDGCELRSERLRGWARERLATYKVPNRWAIVSALPRNAMGKVLKPEVAKAFSQ